VTVHAFGGTLSPAIQGNNMSSELNYTRPYVLDMDGVTVAIDDGTGQNMSFDASDDAFFMFKSEPFLEAYAEIKAQMTPKRMLEIGIYKGGSTVFFDRYFRPETLVGLEFEPNRLPKLDAYARNRAVSTMTIYHGVDQKSVPHLNAMIQKHFSDGIDLVVDDASHWYEETKISFETVLPHVRPGGWYIIEDWSWAHSDAWQAPGNLWEDKPALSNLVFEIVVAHATNSLLIDKVVLSPGVVCLRRGSLALTPGSFRLADHQLARGKTLPQL
jgi:hypothetical protein